MRYLKQFGIIVAFSFAGEMIKSLIPYNIPANIYGLLLMFAALAARVIKPEDMRETAYFLVEIMSVMFIPAGVGLMVSWNLLADILVPVILVALITTVIVMAITGRITQFAIRTGRKKSPEKAGGNRNA